MRFRQLLWGFRPVEKPTIDLRIKSIVFTGIVFEEFCYPVGSANFINRVFIDEG